MGTPRRQKPVLVDFLDSIGIAWGCRDRHSGDDVAAQGDTQPAAGLLPFAALWFASPASRGWTSLSPPVAGRLPMFLWRRPILRLTARRTWRFFETFVTAADPMLPPTMSRKTPAPVLAHRTFANHMGLYLLSTVTPATRVDRTIDRSKRPRATLATMIWLARPLPWPCFNCSDTREPFGRLDPNTYPPSTSAIWARGISSRWRTPCREWARHPFSGGASSRRTADSIESDARGGEPSARRAQHSTCDMAPAR